MRGEWVAFVGRAEPWVYAATGLILWQFPVFDRLHVESGAVLAAVSFFVAGVAAARGGRLIPQLLWPLVTTGILLLSMAWAPNCDILRGSGLFVVMVWPSVILGWAVGTCTRTRSSRPILWTVMLGSFVVILGPLYDLGLHPQFYTYNHVFGGVLGPIYDEELVVRSGFFVFRTMTLLWAGLLVSWARGQVHFTLLAGLVLGVLYVHPGAVGINTPESHLRAQFSGHERTTHFDIYFDTTAVNLEERARLAEDHEWHYERLRILTGVEPASRVASFVYPDNDTRARLTGARQTSVAPVWLRTPQVHVSLSSVASVLPHELAHVFSREFSMPVIRASPLVGLVEGFAVAMEPPSGGPAPEETVLAAYPDSVERRRVAGQVARALSPWGFWSGRAGVSYTWTGAFATHLMKTRGMNAFREVYRTGDFDAVYGQSVDVLMDTWARDVSDLHASLPVDARGIGQHRFSVPSLFEQSCPHWVPLRVRAYRKAMVAADTTGLREVWQRWPTFHEARLGWASLVLLGDKPVPDAPDVFDVLEAIPPQDRHATWFFFAGLHAARDTEFNGPSRGDNNTAHSYLRQALRLSRLSDRAFRLRVLRQLAGTDPVGLAPAHENELMRLTAMDELVELTRNGDLDNARRVGEVLIRESRSVGDFALADLANEWMDRSAWRRSIGSNQRLETTK